MQASVINDRGMASGSPIHCPRDVEWVGTRRVGKQRLELWSCEGHADGLVGATFVGRSNARLVQ